MKAFKELVRMLSKVAGGIAVLVFLRAPFTNTGWTVMAISALVAVVCMAGYTWSEPDEDTSSGEDSH
jgi:hypothetical protein